MEDESRNLQQVQANEEAARAQLAEIFVSIK
jgi:hypothetical protein